MTVDITMQAGVLSPSNERFVCKRTPHAHAGLAGICKVDFFVGLTYWIYTLFPRRPRD